MSNDFIQNAVNNLYRDNELMALKGELANLKAERDQLKADLEKSDGVVWTLSVENARLKAEVERLTHRGDEMSIACLFYANMIRTHLIHLEAPPFNFPYPMSLYASANRWNAAKGVQS